MSLFEQKSLLAKLMATENMIIRQSKVATAYFDVLNRVLTVPILDRNISKELYDLFMGHEVGHALWTEVEGMKKAKSDKVNMSVLNVVEDSRIERKIKTKYPGIKSSFVKGYSELFEQNFFETEGKELSQYNFIDKVNLHCKIGASLALPFDDEEKMLLDEVESTETFEDSVEVTKKICEYMKDKLEEIEKEEKVKVKIVVHGGEGEKSEESGQPEDFEADVEIHVDAEDIKGLSKPNQGEEGEQSKGAAEGSGAGRNEQNIEEQIRSHTDDAYRKNESNLFSKGNEKYAYANVPEFDTSKIVDYKTVIKMLKEEYFVHDSTKFNEYRRESAKIVSYLVKEFELRKNAAQMKKASVAKTGDLNMNRLFSYKFTEDIFKKVTVVPQGQSHGLVMFLDWSGSMAKHFANTMKQLINLVLFCKKVNIPYEVYCFIDGLGYEMNYRDAQRKNGDLIVEEFTIVNLLSSRMSSVDFTYAASALMRMSGADNSSNRVRLPSFLSMSGTPLNETVIAAMEIVPQFQKKHRLQIVNTVFLTDGEGNSIRNVWQNGYGTLEKHSHMIIRDPKTRHEEIADNTVHGYGISNSSQQFDALIRLLKYRTNAHVIGFFVGEMRDVHQRIEYFFGRQESSQSTYALIDKKKEEFRKKDSLIATNTSFDDYYILRSNGLDTDDDEELTFKSNATTRGMASAFAKYAGNKVSSRVILNRFIGLIS